ncbi:DUF736 domain-containing protein, partial [Gluconacetobacter sacchari]
PINARKMESQSRPQNQRVFRTLPVMIDDPLFARPLRARLLPDRDEHDTFHLVWNRPRTPS